MTGASAGFTLRYDGVCVISGGSARCALVVSPEITSAHLEWRDREERRTTTDARGNAVLPVLLAAGSALSGERPGWTPRAMRSRG